ncbi:hypothetical protein F511_08310 [Dorcoceras hygrometricum]|uniref:Uncharacterized protein n=1 Tax=Dorcoceras hygrometricum TaxID=472368 RepID=A0A2Z7B635_9LAMI|nr:hypothetical protein F511_08310 [Dorcoceras hygrometricum]
MAEMQCHTDRGLIPKTQPNLHLAVHVSLHQRFEYDVTRIIVFFRTMDFTSGPDLSYTQSYTSILRLGLAARDTPDAPHNHLWTRGSSSMRQTPTYATKIGNLPEDSLRSGGRYVFPYLNNKIPEDRGEYLAQDTRCRRLFAWICSSPPPRPSINTRGHCDVLSMRMDSDLVIYRTTLVRTFQVSTRCVLGKWVYLVTHAMSLFDLQDVCIVIGSLAILDLPMVVDLIGIYVLKGPYCTLTMTDWFLQALSVIPRGSWGDVARRFTMIRWTDERVVNPVVDRIWRSTAAYR